MTNAAPRFHAHLDVCEQCRKHPFALCPEGCRLLEAEASALNRQIAKLPDGRIVLDY